MFIVTFGEPGTGSHNTGRNADLAAATHGREIARNAFPGVPTFRPGIDVVRVVDIHNVADLVAAVSPGHVAYLAYFGHAGVAMGANDPEGTATVDRTGPGALWIASGSGRGANLTSRGDSSDRPVTDIDRTRFTSDAQIRLFGCRAGLGHPPIAQQLANHLGRNVLAYTSTGGSLFTNDRALGHGDREFESSDLAVRLPATATDVWLVPIGRPTTWSTFRPPPPPRPRRRGTGRTRRGRATGTTRTTRP